MDSVAKRVVRRFLAAAELAEWDFGRFHITAPPNVKQILEEALDKSDKAYAKAGFPLGKRIEVTYGEGHGAAAVYDTSRRYIKVLPHGVRVGALYEALVHELAHWFHDNRLSGGFRNPEVLAKHREVTESRGGPEEAFADQATLEKQLKALMRKQTSLIKKVGDAGKFSLPGFEDRQRQSGTYVREVAAVGIQPMRGSRPFIKLRVFNPSPSDLQQEDTMFGVQILAPVTDALRGLPALAADWQKLEREIAETEAALSVARRHRTIDRYQGTLDEWMPTEYGKTDTDEWFAELLSMAVLNPSRLSAAVLDWLHSLV